MILYTYIFLQDFTFNMHRFAGQFTTAWMNDDPHTAYALFNALCRTGRDDDAKNLSAGVHALYDMAVTSTQQWIKSTAL